MKSYKEWFNNPTETNNIGYFDKFINLSELQRTMINCLKAEAIDIDIYKKINNLITKQLEKLKTKK